MTIRPRPMCSPFGQLAQIGNLIWRIFGDASPAACTASTRVDKDDSEMLAVEKDSLVIKKHFGVKQVKTNQQTEHPGVLHRTPITRGADQHRHTLPRS